MRPRSELESAEQELSEKLWYERHMTLMAQVEQGEAEAGAWVGGAQQAAEDVRRRHGDDLGPYSDFEWGVLNGKLSALRWALGSDWDDLHS